MFHSQRTENRYFSVSRGKTTMVILIIAAFLIPLCGCSSPIFSTDNRLLLYLPGAERRSDTIPGVLTPAQRRALIEEKGEKGSIAPDNEKEVLVYQLIREYKRSTDPTIRRASIDAINKLIVSLDVEPALPLLNEALRDESIGVRLSAAYGLGHYAEKAPKNDARDQVRLQAARLLALRYQELPYSVDTGQKKENDLCKDLRLAILRSLGNFPESPEVLAALREGMDGEPLDDGALRLASMKSLAQVTGKRYGLDYSLWSDYLRYQDGELASPPKEVSIFADRSLGSLNPLK